jgi:G3E family GTPase
VPAVPVLVLAGFLGSGKTTLLNHLLTHAGDTRLGVVVNDFGSVGVDAMLVGRTTGGVVPIGGGCLCCATDEESLRQVLSRLTAPGSDVDVVVIEASGIAEPDRVAAMVEAASGKRVTFGGLVEVVDAVELDAVRRLHTELDRHIGLADLVVVNKADVAEPAVLDGVRAHCATVNERAPLVVTSHGAVDPRLLFDLTVTPGRQLMLAHAVDHSHLHDGYTVVTLDADEPLDPALFVAFLRDRSPDAYRVKGFARFAGTRRRHTVHGVGRHLSIDPGSWPAGSPLCTALEVIGRDLDDAALQKSFLACLSTTRPDLSVLTPFRTRH